MALMPGAPAPWFICATPTNPAFDFGSVAGRYVVLGFLPDAADEAHAALRVTPEQRAVLDDEIACAFLVTRNEAAIAAARDERGVRWFLDRDSSVSRLYHALEEGGRRHPHWLVLDPSLRVLFGAPIDAFPSLLDEVRRLPPPDSHAGTPIHAPVLIVPRVLEPAFCHRLIEVYEQCGGKPSGVMREVNGRTVGVLDTFKRRRDADITDPVLRDLLRARLRHRLVPEIEKAFAFAATRIERDIVACYDAAEGGYFRPHRDNTTAGTAHRRFAVTINLNTEDYEGGDLRFPEFGGRTYRAPTGGAIVFSCSLLHEALPVTKGRRFATLPFLYDDAAAEQRQRNMHLLASAPGSDLAAAASS